MLRYVPINDNGLIAYSDPAWVEHMLPSDSVKKRIVKTVCRLPIIKFLLPKFDGKVLFRSGTVDLEQVLTLVNRVIPSPNISAVFVNGGREPPRIYVWLEANSDDYFLKIGTSNDYELFENEVTLFKNHPPDGVHLMRPLSVLRFGELSMLVSEGFSLQMRERKRRLLPRDIIARFKVGGFPPEGFFGGPVHGDLAGNNIFAIDDDVYVLDWEFSSPEGPSYCDLVELITAILFHENVKPVGIRDLQALVTQLTDLQLPDNVLWEALNFLATRKNPNALRFLATNTGLNLAER